MERRPDAIVHRSDTHRYYRGLSMHAAEGVHEYAQRLIEQKVPAGGSVLDVGCGVGALSQRLMDARYSVTASDLDVSDFGASVPAVAWDVTESSSPFEPSSFDAVTAIEILEHVENPIQAARNLLKVLRPGGVLVCSTPNLGHPRSRIKYFLRGAPSYFGANEYYNTGHRTLLPDWLLERHLLAAGFTAIQLSYAGQLNLRGLGRYPYAILKAVLTVAGGMPQPRVDDGAATFAVARRPLHKHATFVRHRS